jgi:hypothetical protein
MRSGCAIESLVCPIPHGWVTINGKLLDVTAEGARHWLERRTLANPDEHLYEHRGVMVDREMVREHFLRTNICSVVLEETAGRTAHDVGGGSEAYLPGDDEALGRMEESTEVNGLRFRLEQVGRLSACSCKLADCAWRRREARAHAGPLGHCRRSHGG